MRALVRYLALSVIGLTWVACIDNSGVEPPPREFNFPTEMWLAPANGSSGASHLVVADTNFDVRYNAGTLKSLDLDELNREADACAQSNEEDCVIPLSEALVTSEVVIASFASQLAASVDGRRLYVALRSGPTVTAVDFDPSSGQLSCGGTPGSFHPCTDAYAEPLLNPDTRDISFEGDPLDMVVSDLSELGRSEEGTALVTLQRGGFRSGQANLLIDTSLGNSPELRLTDQLDGLPTDMQALQFFPEGLRAWAVNGDINVISQLGLALDADTRSLDDARLFAGTSLTLQRQIDTGSTASTLADLRALQFDPRPDNPNVYLLSRRPEAFIVTDRSRINSATRTLPVQDIIPVGNGASRMTLDIVADRLIAFVTCFDSRDVYVIDIDKRQVLAVVRDVSGPFEAVIDSARERLYVSDFSVSGIRIISLSNLVDCLQNNDSNCSPTVIATVGDPRPVRELR